MEKFITIIYKDSKEVTRVIKAMNKIIKEYGRVSVADLNDLNGDPSTYTDHCYGWTSLAGTRMKEQYLGGQVRVEFPLTKPLEKECKTCKECTDGSTFQKDLEATVQAYCVADCLSTENMILREDKKDLQKELDEVKKELEETKKKYDYLERLYNQIRAGYKSQLDWWHDCAMERYKKLGEAEKENEQLRKELEETKLLVEVVKKDNKHLKIDLEYLCKHLYSKLDKEAYIRFKDLSLMAQALIGVYNYGNKED